MAKILVTGGTVFVSRFVAQYFVNCGDEVWVLNRNTRSQVEGVHLIQADRENLGDALRGHIFDAVLDINSYTREHVEKLVGALDTVREYIFISSSAVYPETLPQPFAEEMECGPNGIWGAYGTNKLEAENWLRGHMPQAYILRPPYLYGPMQNIYREPFVFEWAESGRPFCMPGDGDMPLHFCHVEDLCRFMALLLTQKPEQRIFNVGDPQAVTIRQWVQMCYTAVGAPLEILPVQGHPQRAYFPFYDYGYVLDVSLQCALMPRTKPLSEGLSESWAWFREHRQEVNRKKLMEYIDTHILP